MMWKILILALLFGSLGCDDDEGRTSLHLAAKSGFSGVTEHLIERGEDVHAKDNDGRTPLHYAARENASEATEVLRRYGARR